MDDEEASWCRGGVLLLLLLSLHRIKGCCRRRRGSRNGSRNSNHGDQFPGDRIIIKESGGNFAELLEETRRIRKLLLLLPMRMRLPLSGYGSRRIRNKLSR